MKLSIKNTSIPRVHSFSRSRTSLEAKSWIKSSKGRMPQYRLGSPSLKVGSRPPAVFHATLPMASRSPLQEASLAMFRLKVVGNSLTLELVVPKAT